MDGHVRWRLRYGTYDLDEPPGDVSIRDVPRGAVALQAVTTAAPSLLPWRRRTRAGGERVLREIVLPPGAHPVWLVCTGFAGTPDAGRAVCVIFGWGRPEDDGIQTHVEAIYRGRHQPDPPPAYLDAGALHGIFAQTAFPKGGDPWTLPMSYTSSTRQLVIPTAWWERLRPFDLQGTPP